MKNLFHICFLTAILFVLTVFLSCSDDKKIQNSNIKVSQDIKISDSNTNQFDVAEFERNKELWTSKNIQNYKMIIGAEGFLTNFPEQGLVEVRNRQAKSIKSLSKTGRNHTQSYKNFDTVEKLFDFIENRKKAFKLDVMFDKNLGYPSQVIYAGRTDVADDELQLQVKSLEVIK